MVDKGQFCINVIILRNHYLSWWVLLSRSTSLDPKQFIRILLLLDTQDYIGCYDYDSLDKVQSHSDQELWKFDFIITYIGKLDNTFRELGHQLATVLVIVLLEIFLLL